MIVIVGVWLAGLGVILATFTTYAVILGRQTLNPASLGVAFAASLALVALGVRLWAGSL